YVVFTWLEFRRVLFRSSFSFMVLQLGRVGIVLFLPSIAVSLVTGISIELCILVMGIVSIVYTMMGGIEAVIWTDVLQVVVLMGRSEERRVGTEGRTVCR